MINREIKVGDKIRWLTASNSAKLSGDDVYEVNAVDRNAAMIWDNRGRALGNVFCKPENYEHIDEPQADPVNHSGSKYLRTIQLIEGKVDVYAMLVAFDVRCPARQHAIKKLLCAGLRGKGDELQDLHEAGDAVRRAIQIAEAGKCE
jgi:hypothetical protein